jgi:hypothetical protein
VDPRATVQTNPTYASASSSSSLPLFGISPSEANNSTPVAKKQKVIQIVPSFTIDNAEHALTDTTKKVIINGKTFTQVKERDKSHSSTEKRKTPDKDGSAKKSKKSIARDIQITYGLETDFGHYKVDCF